MDWTRYNSHLDVANAVLEAVLSHQPLLVPDEILHLLNLHPELLRRRTVHKVAFKLFQAITNFRLQIDCSTHYNSTCNSSQSQGPVPNKF
jgi:hypothetical protein